MKILITSLMATLLAGCASTKPQYSGPIISLPAIDGPVADDGLPNAAIVPTNFDELASHTTAPLVSVIDKRPGWQARYYNGSLSPRDWQIARTIIPMDNFQPDVELHIANAVRHRLQSVHRKPSAITITVNSFECVVDISQEMRARLEREVDERLDDFEEEKKKRRERRREERRQEIESERQLARVRGQKYNEPSFSEELVDELFQGLFDAIGDARHKRKIKRGETLPEFHPSKNYDVTLAPPIEHRRDYPDGISCRIKATVDIAWPDKTATFITTIDSLDEHTNFSDGTPAIQTGSQQQHSYRQDDPSQLEASSPIEGVVMQAVARLAAEVQSRCEP